MRSFLLIFAFVYVCRAQAPALDDAQGSMVEGRVISTGGEPLPHATVQINGVVNFSRITGQPTDRRVSYKAETDEKGQFVFDRIDPRTYTLLVQHEGYVQSSGSAPLLDQLKPGQKVVGLVIRMQPQSSISGRVTDEDGNVLAGAGITVLRSDYVGRKVLAVVSDVTTRQDGSFRVPNLTPGRYYVRATEANEMMNDIKIAPGQDVPKEGFAQTFYPGTTDPSAAASIPVAAGAEITGIDVRMRKVVKYHIAGKIDDSAAPPHSGVAVWILRTDGIPIYDRSLRMPIVSDGRFEFTGLVEGTYAVNVSQGDGPSKLRGREVVVLGRENVDNVVVRLAPPLTMLARFSTEENDPIQDFSKVGVRLAPGEESFDNITQTNDHQTIHLAGVVPGPYQLTVTGLPPGMYAKSVRFDNADVSGKWFDIGPAGGTFDVLMSRKAGDVSGTVQNPDGTPVASVPVAIWRPGFLPPGTIDSGMRTRTDANGNFQFFNLPPGEYRVAAWSSAYVASSINPEFRAQFSGSAAVVKLGESGHEIMRVELVADRAAEAAVANMR